MQQLEVRRNMMLIEDLRKDIRKNIDEQGPSLIKSIFFNTKINH